MKTIHTKVATFSYNPNERLLHMKIMDGAEIELENAIENYEAAQLLVGGHKHLLLVDATSNVYISKEAKTYSAKQKPNSPVAMAVIATSTANRLVGNFYINFNKPTVPTKLFATEEKAIEWLKTFLYLTEPENTSGEMQS
ncbi:MAG TPA: hypothetical protein PLL00_13030 [Bacteroidia bacterium]|nr:hypothetical protein [Bacteroidia bacterium]